MAKLELYNKAFAETFGKDETCISNLEYNAIPEWDSVGHMSLIGAIEEAYDIMMEMDDIIDFSSYSKGIEILKKYNIELTE